VLREGPKTPGPYATLADARTAGAATFNYGLFLTTVVTFLIVGFVVYSLVRPAARFTPKPAEGPATTKECPYCLSKIAFKATRCAYCTAEIRG